jgi:hypothetical protein
MGLFPTPRGSGSHQRQLIGSYRNIGFAVALEQQRCRFILRQRVGTTVAEIELGIVSSTAVARVKLTSHARPFDGREWNYFDVQFCESQIEISGALIAAPRDCGQSVCLITRPSRGLDAIAIIWLYRLGGAGRKAGSSGSCRTSTQIFER